MSFIRTSRYRGFATQTLRNVLVNSPSIFWVQQGAKDLGSQRIADEHQLLLVPARTRLQFANQPRQGEFLAHQICLLVPPKRLKQEALTPAVYTPPLLPLTPLLRQLCLLSLLPQSTAMQQHLLAMWHQQLVELGALTYLYSAVQASVCEQLQQWFLQAPQADHQLDSCAEKLAMSRATLMRRLLSEGTTFRQLLIDCRMNQALTFMQQGMSVTLVPQACGYESEARFRQRFVAHFGVTPLDYFQTLQPTRKV